METKKTTTTTYDILNILQYLISILIMLSFIISLIPYAYKNIFVITIGLIALQLLISLARLKLINFLIETIILALSLLALIPILGYLFKFIAIPITILDISALKNTIIYKKVEIFSDNINPKKPKTKTKKFNSEEIHDAQFKEK